MSDFQRREKWFRGYRRLLQFDPAKMDSIRNEILMAKQSKSYAGGTFAMKNRNLK